MKPKVLLANWSWYPTGGDWTYVSNLKTLYEQKGYQVIPFSISNPKNLPTDYAQNFVEGNDYSSLNKQKNIATGIRVLRDSVVSKKALTVLQNILDQHQIQVAHLHNIHHHLTPAIIWKLKAAGARVIWTLHDYKIICPENSFVSNGTICEKCITGKFYHCATNKCKKGSLLASSLASFEAYYYHNSSVYDQVDAYLCPSLFLRSKFLQFGFPEQKLFLTNYCYDIESLDRERQGEEQLSNTPYILYVGRIEKLKGIKTLIDAVASTGIRLKVAGTGAYYAELEKFISNNAITNVELLGFQDKKKVYDLTLQSLFVVCPSEWYENFPFSIIETLLLSKPVIASNIGGIPELVLHQKTGLLFEPGNTADLQAQIIQLYNNKSDQKAFGENGKAHAEKLVNFSDHWSKLEPLLKNIV